MGGDGKTEANWDNIADGIEPATATEDGPDETEALVDSPEKMQEAIDHFIDDCRKSIMYHPEVEKDKLKNGLVSGAASHYGIPGYGLLEDAKDRRPEDQAWIEHLYEKAISASGAQSETQGVAEGANTGNNSAGSGKKDGFFSRLFGRGK